MKWFKHLSGSLKDSIIFEAIEKFGGDGYLVFFGTLEMMADEFDIYQPDRVTLSLKKMTNLLQLSRQKTVRILRFFDEKAKKYSRENKSFFTEINETHVTIICNRFASLADNHTANELAKTKKLLRSNLEVTYPQDIKDNTDNTEEDSLLPPNGGNVPGPFGDISGEGGNSDPKSPVCPHQEIVALYHEILPSLTRVKEWTDQRQGLLRTRWKEKPERQTVEWWRSFFEYVSKSDFLMGRAENFRADLEWLIRPKNFVKVIEGKYHGRNGMNPLMSKSSEGIIGWAARHKARIKQGEHRDA